MENEGGGWTSIQRRGVIVEPKRTRESFYKNWEDYENGFGNPEKDYWIGKRSPLKILLKYVSIFN